MLAKFGPILPGLITCAMGRALDFATTWIGLTRGLAAEAKPGAAEITLWLGPQLGLVCYEAFITTPAIFVGSWLMRYRQGRRAGLFYFVGLISLATGIHNCFIVW